MPGLVIVLSGVALVGQLSARAASGQDVIDPHQEYNVKAVYLYSFGRYVAWPDDAKVEVGRFVIGVLGDSPITNTLKQIAQKKKVAGKPIVIRRFQSHADIHQCHILFLSKDLSAEEERDVIRSIGKQPVLLVSETMGFAARGGTANFFLTDGTIRFEINVQAAKRQRLSIDAKLLSLARLVDGSRSSTTMLSWPTSRRR